MKKRVTPNLFILLLAGLTAQLPVYAAGINSGQEDGINLIYLANDDETSNWLFREFDQNSLDHAGFPGSSDGMLSTNSRYLRELSNTNHFTDVRSQVNTVDPRSRIQSLERQIAVRREMMLRERNNRNKKIFWGVMSLAATGGALYLYDYYDDDEDTFLTIMAIGAAPALGVLTIFRFSDARTHNRRYKSEKRHLGELEDNLRTLQRLFTSVELAPKIDLHNSSLTLSINMRF